MFGVTGRTVRPARPMGIAVVPGRESDAGACDACGSTTAPTARTVAERVELVTCLDFAGCCARYRHKTSPSTYAACLRGEILGVAP